MINRRVKETRYFHMTFDQEVSTGSVALLPERERERILQSDVLGIMINEVCASKKVRKTDSEGGQNRRVKTKKQP